MGEGPPGSGSISKDLFKSVQNKNMVYCFIHKEIQETLMFSF